MRTFLTVVEFLVGEVTNIGVICIILSILSIGLYLLYYLTYSSCNLFCFISSYCLTWLLRFFMMFNIGYILIEKANFNEVTAYIIGILYICYDFCRGGFFINNPQDEIKAGTIIYLFLQFIEVMIWIFINFYFGKVWIYLLLLCINSIFQGVTIKVEETYRNY